MPSLTSVDGVNINVAGAKVVNVGTPTLSTDATTFIDLQNYVPTGCVKMYAGSTPPSSWLICDGGAVSRTTYADLFAVIGTTYGQGNGSTTFNVPDMRGNVVVGHNGSTYNRGSTGGSPTHEITTAEMPIHSHTGTSDVGGAHSHTGTIGSTGSHQHTGSTDYTDVSHKHKQTLGPIDDKNFSNVYGQNPPADGDGTVESGSYTDYASINHNHSFTTSSAGSHSHSLTIDSSTPHQHTFTTNTTGSGNAMSLMQPYIVMHYIIKT